jgi:hypothetical protein
VHAWVQIGTDYSIEKGCVFVNWQTRFLDFKFHLELTGEEVVEYPQKMKERIERGDDECLYQPKIHSKRIRSLYRIRADTNLPMTVLVDLAIKEFIDRYQVAMEQNQELIETPGSDMPGICELDREGSQAFLDSQ